MAKRTVSCKNMDIRTGQPCGKAMTYVKDQVVGRRSRAYVFRCYACGALRVVTA